MAEVGAHGEQDLEVGVAHRATQLGGLVVGVEHGTTTAPMRVAANQPRTHSGLFGASSPTWVPLPTPEASRPLASSRRPVHRLGVGEALVTEDHEGAVGRLLRADRAAASPLVGVKGGKCTVRVTGIALPLDRRAGRLADHAARIHDVTEMSRTGLRDVHEPAEVAAHDLGDVVGAAGRRARRRS